MKKHWKEWSTIVICLFAFGLAGVAYASAPEAAHGETPEFPPSLESYHDADMESIGSILRNRISQEPFNLVSTLIFLCAIIHTFLTSKFLAYAHKWEHEHREKIKQGLAHKHSVHIPAGIFHFLGEVEVVFGLWVVALCAAILFYYDLHTVVSYITHKVNFTEAMFVVVIMILASTRPILKLAEMLMLKIANLMGGTLAAWWLTILTVGPLLGSLITEPAAMIISALLLAHKLYDLGPSMKFKYATIGLLFVNISIGGTLTHFAAPPVLMVAGPWGWGMGHMIASFGWKAVVAILISNGIYFFVFRKELLDLQEKYARKNLKDEIQRTYLSHRDLETEVDRAIAAVETDPEFAHSLKEQLDEKVDEFGVRHGPEVKQYATGSEILVLGRPRRLVITALPTDRKRPRFDLTEEVLGLEIPPADIFDPRSTIEKYLRRLARPDLNARVYKWGAEIGHHLKKMGNDGPGDPLLDKKLEETKQSFIYEGA